MCIISSGPNGFTVAHLRPRYLCRLHFGIAIKESRIDDPIESVRPSRNVNRYLNYNMEDTMPVRCKKCRNLLFLHPECPLLNVHGNIINTEDKECQPIQQCSVWYLDSEKIPSWISSAVEEVGWTKGKLCCPNCKYRLGSFDFVSGSQCPCRSHTLPALHLVKTKVDALPGVSLPHSDLMSQIKS